MADALVSVIVKEVVRTLASVATKELALLRGLEGDILSLTDDFEQIQAVLLDAEEKQVQNNAVALWLKRLRSASLEVENVLDEISTEALLQSLHKKRVKYRARAFFSFNHNKYTSRVRIAHKVKDIRRKLDDITSKRFDLNLTPSDAISDVDDMGVAGQMLERETSSLVHDSLLIFGRNEETEMVTEKICNKDFGKHDNGEIRVYGIWGMGGVGKTTLAQLVYNHQRVNQYFDFKCWVYVSQNFKVKEILKKIIESIDNCGCTLTLLDKLEESLQSKLRGNKFLIILDDVWIENSEKTKWDHLSKILRCGAEGSIVVITTRSHTTSRMMAKVPELQHKVGCLSEEDSWFLFKKLAFAQGREGDELEPIGWEIVEKCKGLPLAVKTLGSLMWSKTNISDWQCVKHNNIWELEEIDVLPAILKLSYDNLLPHLKRCFAYCCLFPKGYEIDKAAVIQLWVVNGFIPPRGEIDLYVLGEEVFNCLIWRSFFQVVIKDYRYKIHDLIHDMARHVMRDDCLVIETGKEVVIPNEALHLSSSCPNFHLSPEDLGKLISLRSIFMFGEEYKRSICQIFNHLHLRVLYLPFTGLKTLPESICKLRHLRYLNLSYSSIEVLPESIIYLQNLQVLILYFCYKLCKLPRGLRYMRNLERLDINSCSLLHHLPFGIEKLTSLRTLPQFPVANKSGAKIGELADLNLLEGMLEISRLDNVRGLAEAKSANLICKTNLSVLKLSWLDNDTKQCTAKMVASDEEVLAGLETNPSLKELMIRYYKGKIILSSWMVNLRNLVKIAFFKCKNCEHIPLLGRLPNLRVIRLVLMHSLECFHDEDTNSLEDTTDMFVCVEELHIDNCPNLVSLPAKLPKLKVLRLYRCKKLVSLPNDIQSFKDMNELLIERCKHLSKKYEKKIGADWPKISHIPNISISKYGLYESGVIEDEDTDYATVNAHEGLTETISHLGNLKDMIWIKKMMMMNKMQIQWMELKRKMKLTRLKNDG